MRDRRFIASIRTGLALALATMLCVGVLATTAIAKPAPVTKIGFFLDDHNVPQGSAVTSSILVQTRGDHEWTSFAAATLSVSLDGTDVMTLTTDSTGVAALSFVAAPGDHVMKVVFAGDATHERAQRAQGFSVIAGATPPPIIPVPAAPVLTGIPGSPGVHLSWTVPSDGGSPILIYYVYRGTTSGGESFIAILPDTFFDDFAVIKGTTYYYEVSAVNANGEGARSTEVAVTPL